MINISSYHNHCISHWKEIQDILDKFPVSLFGNFFFLNMVDIEQGNSEKLHSVIFNIL